ncbi:MAG TPA: hypothetical protein PLE32_14850, partial [Haliscomenobacter sp.]|nr:hypothetical protein [Haliscomenobacter sp.]
NKLNIFYCMIKKGKKKSRQLIVYHVFIKKLLPFFSKKDLKGYKHSPQNALKFVLQRLITGLD